MTNPTLHNASKYHAGPITAMKLSGRHLVVLVALASCVARAGVTAAIMPHAVVGHWEGAFTRFGSAQTVALDVYSSDSGLTGTYDIPDLLLYREPLKSIRIDGDTLAFRLFWGQFKCLVHDENGEITGQNLDWGPPVSIHLRRSAMTSRVRIEPVTFESGPLSLVGELLTPHGNPPFPAVIMIEGSTTEGRKNWTYRSMGELLARNGIATFIYDKRGVGESDGDVGAATFNDLASDAAAAVRALVARSDIDSRAIGLLGISQGGWLAPMAAQKCDSVSFLILVVGAATSVWDQELHRVAYTMRAGSLNDDQPDSFSVEEIADALEHTRLGFSVASNPERWGEWNRSVAQAKASRWSRYVALDSSIDELQGWLRQQFDPSEVLRHTTIPVLALFGEEDTYVPPKENVDRMRTLLAEAGNKDVTTVVYPGCGHALIRNATLIGHEWEWPNGYWQWARRAPGVADSLVLWTLRVTQTR